VTAWWKGLGVSRMLLCEATNDEPEVDNDGNEFENIDVDRACFHCLFEVIMNIVAIEDGEGTSNEVRNGEVPHVGQVSRPTAHTIG